MTPNKLLKLIETMVSYSDAEEVMLDVRLKRKVSKRERRMATALSDIYRFTHGNSTDCWHKNWVKESEDKYKEFVNNNIL